jgi:prevent-host-death family protein
MRFINVRELKSRTSEILKAAAGESIVVTNRGKPVAVIKGVADSEFEIPSFGRMPGAIREAPAPYESADVSVPAPGWGGGAIPPKEFEAQNKSNPLKAVFWDYPELTEEPILRQKIREAREGTPRDAFRWYMARFLESGRVADTLRLFGLDEIRRTLPSLKISPRAVSRWTRVLDFYGRD